MLRGRDPLRGSAPLKDMYRLYHVRGVRPRLTALIKPDGNNRCSQSLCNIRTASQARIAVMIDDKRPAGGVVAGPRSVQVIGGTGAGFARAAGGTPIRFLLAAAFNTVFGYSVYAAGIASGLHYAWAMSVATIVGICFNYCTYGRLVFRAELTLRRFGRHLVTYAATYALNIAAIKLCLAAGINAYGGGAISLVPCAAFAYVLNRRYVFASGRWQNGKPD